MEDNPIYQGAINNIPLHIRNAIILLSPGPLCQHC